MSLGDDLVKASEYYEHRPLGAWRMSWRCGLDIQVAFFAASHAIFLSSFFRFDVLV
jgi:hypothetical protein